MHYRKRKHMGYYLYVTKDKVCAHIYAVLYVYIHLSHGQKSCLRKQECSAQRGFVHIVSLRVVNMLGAAEKVRSQGICVAVRLCTRCRMTTPHSTNHLAKRKTLIKTTTVVVHA